MRKQSEFYLEARRCADMASRGVSPRMFYGLSSFYQTLAETAAKDGPVPKIGRKPRRHLKSEKLF
jgi:hypothetical protein